MLFALVLLFYNGFLEQPQELNTPGSHIQYLVVYNNNPVRGITIVCNTDEIRRLHS